jgi:hypothetical protein
MDLSSDKSDMMDLDLKWRMWRWDILIGTEEEWVIKKMVEKRQEKTAFQTVQTLCVLKDIPDEVEELIYKESTKISPKELYDQSQELLFPQVFHPSEYNILRKQCLNEWLKENNWREVCEKLKPHIKHGYKGKVLAMIKANLCLQEALINTRWANPLRSHTRCWVGSQERTGLRKMIDGGRAYNWEL